MVCGRRGYIEGICGEAHGAAHDRAHCELLEDVRGEGTGVGGKGCEVEVACREMKEWS